MMQVLCSEQGRDELLKSGIAGITPVLLTDAAAAQAALVTRDVWGNSTDSQLQQHTADFFKALEQAPQLQWVHTYASGIDRPVYQQLIARGMRVTNSAGANAETVAHTALAGFLYFTRQLHVAQRQQREHRWQALQHVQVPALNQLHALIVGWGAIGQRVGKHLGRLGVRCRVLRASGHPVTEGWPTGTYTQLEEHIGHVDWLVLACPLTDQTRHLFSSNTLKQLRSARPLNLINVARGAIVDTEALLHAHEQGLVKHAYLDVFQTEPLPAEDPLWSNPDFLLSPHMAGTSNGNRQAVISRFAELVNQST